MTTDVDVLELCLALKHTALSTAIRESTWTFPLIYSAHVLGLAASVGLIVWLDLRLLGLVLRDHPVTALHRRLLPLALRGFALMFLTGLLLFIAQPVKSWTSPFFKAKLALLVLCAVVAVAYQVAVFPSVARWDGGPPPTSARVAGALGVLLWAGVIAAGRTMSFTF